MIQEGNMGEWKMVYEDEVEERWVTVKVYETEDDMDGDEGPAVRVTAAPIEDDGVIWSRMATDRRLLQDRRARITQSHSSLIRLRTSRRS